MKKSKPSCPRYGRVVRAGRPAPATLAPAAVQRFTREVKTSRLMLGDRWTSRVAGAKSSCPGDGSATTNRTPIRGTKTLPRPPKQESITGFWTGADVSDLRQLVAGAVLAARGAGWPRRRRGTTRSRRPRSACGRAGTRCCPGASCWSSSGSTSTSQVGRSRVFRQRQEVVDVVGQAVVLGLELLGLQVDGPGAAPRP